MVLLKKFSQTLFIGFFTGFSEVSVEQFSENLFTGFFTGFFRGVC